MHNHYGHAFTLDEDQNLREMQARLLTLRQIAEKLGMTKGQIAGRIHRLGLVGKGRPPKKRRFVATIPDQRPAGVLTNCGHIQKYADIPLSHPRTCQWIDGDVRQGQWSKCGAPSKDGSSYCPDHHARCYVPVQIG